MKGAMKGAMRKNRSVSMPGRKSAMGANKPVKRSVSLPTMRPKSAMRVATLDDSLHKKGLHKNPARPSGIEFHEIRIREYARALGDNPSCSSGPPVSIGWEYNPKEIHLKVEKYEDKRPQRRSMNEMVLPREVRFKMLTQEWEVSRKECAEATRQSLKVKNQRRQTVRNMGKAPHVEEKMENVGKMFKRSLSLKKKKSVEDLMASANKAKSGLSAAAAKDYEWEPDEDESGSLHSTGSRASSAGGDDVCLPYVKEQAPGDDDGDEPETARPPRSSPIKSKVPLPPARKSLSGSYHGKPIVISEDDCIA